MTEQTPWFRRAQSRAAEVAARLESLSADRVVFAESCTAGMVAALLGQHPGISNWLCGSAVTYRESVKRQWIGVDPETLRRESAESMATTREMALGVLRETVEATIAAAITGHLGPGAPVESDGVVHIAIAMLEQQPESEPNGVIVASESIRLESSSRIDRQSESVEHVLSQLLKQLA